jgi:hypothetical protein
MLSNEDRVRVKTMVAKARAKRFAGSKKGDGDSQLDLFEDEGGRRYSRQYVRSTIEELRAKRKGGGPKVMGKARFSSRSEAGRYAANMRWRGRTGDLTDTNARDFAQFGELSAKQLKEVAARAKDLARTGLVVTPEAYYKDNAQSFNFPVPGFQGKRDRSMTDNDLNDDGEDIASLRENYANDIVTDFADLPDGGFRETVIQSFIDRQANSFYEEPGRSRGPYDRPVSRMDDKQYAKARAYALKGRLDNGPSLLDEYWDDNESDFWDEYDSVLEGDK